MVAFSIIVNRYDADWLRKDAEEFVNDALIYGYTIGMDKDFEFKVIDLDRYYSKVYIMDNDKYSYVKISTDYVSIYEGIFGSRGYDIPRMDIESIELINI